MSTELLYIGSNGHVAAVDPGTGNVTWKNGLKGRGCNDVAMAIAGTSIQFVSAHSHSHSGT